LSDLDELIKIRGVGKETLFDIKRSFKSIKKLIKALKKDKVPLRNDIVKKLKRKLL